MIEIAKAAYLDEVLFSGINSKERFEILSFIELAQRLEPEQLVDHVDTHLKMRMFLVGHNITAADIIVHLVIAKFFQGLMDFQKQSSKEENGKKQGYPNAFRWLDHIQHLPGMSEQVEQLGVFVMFPDPDKSEPSKGELK